MSAIERQGLVAEIRKHLDARDCDYFTHDEWLAALLELVPPTERYEPSQAAYHAFWAELGHAPGDAVPIPAASWRAFNAALRAAYAVDFGARLSQGEPK